MSESFDVQLNTMADEMKIVVKSSFFLLLLRLLSGRSRTPILVRRH